MNPTKKSVTVLGSLNMDLSVATDRMPVIGETRFGSDFRVSPGGKGLNQAVATARCGGSVRFIGAVGADDFGIRLKQCLLDCGADISQIRTLEDAPTGNAMIFVVEGDNSIIITSGANGRITEDYVSDAVLQGTGILLAQLETPAAATAAAFCRAKKNGVTTILNPAPAGELSPELLAHTDILIPNEIECEGITGISISDDRSILEAFRSLENKGVRRVLMTVGAKGVVYAENGELRRVPAYRVEAVDTTAAGDSFCGALAVRLNAGESLEEAIRYATAVSAIAVTRRGASDSIPLREETEEFLRTHPLPRP